MSSKARRGRLVILEHRRDNLARAARELARTPEVKRAIRDWKRQLKPFLATIAAMQEEGRGFIELLENPTLRDHFARTAMTIERARRGERRDLANVVAQFGLGAFADPDILIAVERLDPHDRSDRDTLEEIAKAVRSVLLPPRRRRKPEYIHEVRTLVPLVQGAYDANKKRLKPHYRNPHARELAIAEVSARIGAAVPEPFRLVIENVAKARLQASRQWPHRGFGVEVVAEAFSRSSRQLRSHRS